MSSVLATCSAHPPLSPVTPFSRAKFASTGCRAAQDEAAAKDPRLLRVGDPHFRRRRRHRRRRGCVFGGPSSRARPLARGVRRRSVVGCRSRRWGRPALHLVSVSDPAVAEAWVGAAHPAAVPFPRQRRWQWKRGW